MPARFLSLDDVATELAISRSQAYALVRNGDLPAMKIGGRGQWRVERARLEEWIVAGHEETAKFVQEHPLTGPVEDDELAPSGLTPATSGDDSGCR